MKTTLLFLAAILSVSSSVLAQKGEDKSKRVSPPAVATARINGGATITINYGQPSVKGRTIGKNLEPVEGQLWRAGANEATVFETDKDVKVEGKMLPAGKYAFFTMDNGREWTLIFNKKWNVWGAFSYDKDKGEDALKVTVMEQKAPRFSEKLTYTITKDGVVTLTWGDKLIRFKVAV
jgi:hypothetical protein